MGKYATSISIKAEQIERMIQLGYTDAELGAFLKACKSYVTDAEEDEEAEVKEIKL